MKGENIFKLCLLFFIVGIQIIGLSASSGLKVIGVPGQTQIELEDVDTVLSQTYRIGEGYSGFISKFENANDDNFLKRLWIKVTPPEGEEVYLYTYAVPYARNFSKYTTADDDVDDDVDDVIDDDVVGDDDIMGGPDMQVPSQAEITYEDVDTSAKATDYVGWDDFY